MDSYVVVKRVFFVCLLGVADCSQASQTGDARDKFFAQPVPEFDPRASANDILSRY